MDSPTIYHSLKTVLDVLCNPQYKNNPDVVRLLQIYNDILHKEQSKSSEEERKKHPFIVIEGLDASGKTTVSETLAEKIEADTCSELKQYVFQLREAFDNNEELRTAYYVLLNYITALQISNTLRERPVVLDRYWPSTIAYGIARSIKSNPEENKVPPYGDEIYKWPSDLLKPDIILFISIRESVRVRRYLARNTTTNEEVSIKKDKNHRKNILTIYQNIMGSLIEYVDGNLPRDYVFTEAYDKIKHLLPDQ